MPYTFDFDLTNGILRGRLIGQITDLVVGDFLRAAAQYATRTQPAAGIVDLSQVTEFAVSSQVIEALAKSTPAVPDPHLARVVIAPSPEIYELMRMFETEGAAARPGIRLVRSEQEAWAILAVREPHFYPIDTL